jgi:hypothetical protein
MRTRNGDYEASAPRFHLGDLLFGILVLALVLSIMARAVRTGSSLEWRAAEAAFAVFGLMFSPVVCIWAVIRFAPTSLSAERDAVSLILKSLLVMILLIVSFVINNK